MTGASPPETAGFASSGEDLSPMADFLLSVVRHVLADLLVVLILDRMK